MMLVEEYMTIEGEVITNRLTVVVLTRQPVLGDDVSSLGVAGEPVGSAG